MNDSKLVGVEGHAAVFSDGATLPLGEGVTCVPFAEGALLVWEMEGVASRRCGRIAAGRKRADVESFLCYLNAREDGR